MIVYSACREITESKQSKPECLEGETHYGVSYPLNYFSEIVCTTNVLEIESFRNLVLLLITLLLFLEKLPFHTSQDIITSDIYVHTVQEDSETYPEVSRGENLLRVYFSCDKENLALHIAICSGE